MSQGICVWAVWAGHAHQTAVSRQHRMAALPPGRHLAHEVSGPNPFEEPLRTAT